MFNINAIMAHRRLLTATIYGDTDGLRNSFGDIWLRAEDRDQVLTRVITDNNIDMARVYYGTFGVNATENHLEAAILASHHDMAMYIISVGAPVTNASLLCHALHNKMYDMVDYLMSCGLSVGDVRDTYEYNCFVYHTNLTAKDVRYFVKMGGWKPWLSPHDYAFEITHEKHGHHKELKEYLKETVRRYDGRLADITIYHP